MGTAAVKCPCGWLVTRSTSRGTWSLMDSADPPPLRPIEEHVVEALAQVPADRITCACGRTYFAIGHNPWIVAEDTS